jgi:hypothetical protein
LRSASVPLAFFFEIEKGEDEIEEVQDPSLQA